MIELLRQAFSRKAETGAGVYPMTAYPSLTSLSKRPEALMGEAIALYRRNTWVAAAERTIMWRLSRAVWHLEDENGDTIDRGASSQSDALLDVLERPNPQQSRRQLWELTGRHMGLAGNGFWYLDQTSLLAGTPLHTLYINPSRMTAVESPTGKLLGWVMDHANNPLTPRGAQAVPFELSELVHFRLNEPDTGHYGIGIPETAFVDIELARLSARHASLVLAAGGRLAGILAPKQGEVMEGTAWQQVVNDYRNIVSDEDSAKRLHIVRGAVDFTKTTASPTEMQLVELVHLGRDDVLAAWNVPPSQVGVQGRVGLNSGETQKYEEAALWQGAIEPRLDAMVETIQHGIVDLWISLGFTARLIVDRPTFDDEKPLFENAERAKIVPLNNNERRALVKLPPLADVALGEQVMIDKSMVLIGTVEEEAPADEGVLPVAKASLAEKLGGLRSRTEVTWHPRLQRAMRDLLRQQAAEVAARLEGKVAHLKRRPSDVEAVWTDETERERMEATLLPILEELAEDVADRVTSQMDKRPKKASTDTLEAVRTFVRSRGLERIADMLSTTRSDLQRLIEQGISDGLPPAELGQAIRDATAFNEARAEMIARTETMLAYNDAALRSYDHLEVAEVEAIDGDQDAECAARNGKVYPVSEAYGITDHPNGTLDWIPIVKAAPVVTPSAPEQAPSSEVVEVVELGLAEVRRKAEAAQAKREARLVREQAALAAEVRRLAEAQAQAQAVQEAALSQVAAEVKALVARPTRKVVKRDATGRIVEIVDA